MFVSMFNVCVDVRNVDKGRELYNLILKVGWDIDFFVGIVLINMYIKCGDIGDVIKVFDNLLMWDLVIWILMIIGLVWYGWFK